MKYYLLGFASILLLAGCSNEGSKTTDTQAMTGNGQAMEMEVKMDTMVMGEEAETEPAMEMKAMDMDALPCHQMPNGMWMGDCDETVK